METNDELQKKLKRDALNQMMVESDTYSSSDQRYIRNILHRTAGNRGTESAIAYSPFMDNRYQGRIPEESELTGELRARVVEAMRVDTMASQYLKDIYPDIYEEAQAQEKELKQWASYSTWDKIKMGYSRETFNRKKKSAIRDLQSKALLRQSRKETLQRRRSFFEGRRDIQTDKLEEIVQGDLTEAQLAELEEEDRAKYLAAHSMLRHQNKFNAKRTEGRNSVLSILRSCVRTSPAELERRTMHERALMQQPAEVTAYVHDQMLIHPEFYAEGIPLICQKPQAQTLKGQAKADADAEAMAKMQQLDMDLHTLTTATGTDGEAAFRRCSDVVSFQYETLFGMVSTKPEFFSGAMHPEKLMFSYRGGERGDALINEGSTDVPENFTSLYEARRRCKTTKTLLSTLEQSPYWQAGRYERKNRAYAQHLDQMKVFLEAMDEYLTDTFKNVKDWDRMYRKDTDEEPVYTTVPFAQILRKKESEMGLR